MWLAIRKFIPLAVWRKSWRRSLARTRDISRGILPLETYSFMAHIWLKNTIQVFPGPGAQWYSQDPFHLLAWFTPCGPHFPTVFLFMNSSSFTLHLPSGKEGSLYGYVNGCLDWPWLTLIRSCAHLWSSHCCQRDSGCWLINLDNNYVKLRQSCTGKLAIKIIFS